MRLYKLLGRLVVLSVGRSVHFQLFFFIQNIKTFSKIHFEIFFFELVMVFCVGFRLWFRLWLSSETLVEFIDFG